MKPKLKWIIILISILVTKEGTAISEDNPAESESDNYDETESKYLSVINQNVDVLQKNETSQMRFSECGFEKDDFKKIITATSKAMDFFTLHLHNIVLDAAIGTRLFQSQLKLMQDGHPRLPNPLQLYLTNLQLQNELLSELIIESVSDSNQYSKLSKQEQLPWVANSSLWEQPEEWKSLKDLENDQFNGSSFKEFDRAVEVMTEEISDKCTAELFESCQVTDNCSQVFMEKSHSAYSLTHQVLFFLVAHKKNCFQNEHFISKTKGNSPTTFLESLCKDVLMEANFIEHNGYPGNYRDLLSEQITVCAVAGYPNLLKRKWMNEILSWQNHESAGCFSLENAENEVEKMKEQEEDEPLIAEEEIEEILRADPSLNVNKRGTKRTPPKNSRNVVGGGVRKVKRVKRSDEIVKIGNKNCSIHFTAVSLGALSMYARYFTDTCLSYY